MLISIQKEFIYILIMLCCQIICHKYLMFTIFILGLNEFISSISMIFLIIFYIFEKDIFRKKYNDKKENNIQKDEIWNLKSFILIICSIILININKYHFECIKEELDDLEKNTTMIILLILIETFFFNKYIYSHQILSFIILIIIFFLISKFIQSEIQYYNIISILQIYC